MIDVKFEELEIRIIIRALKIYLMHFKSDLNSLKEKDLDKTVKTGREEVINNNIRKITFLNKKINDALKDKD